jgi:hypothetical protein
MEPKPPAPPSAPTYADVARDLTGQTYADVATSAPTYADSVYPTDQNIKEN